MWVWMCIFHSLHGDQRKLESVPSIVSSWRGTEIHVARLGQQTLSPSELSSSLIQHFVPISISTRFFRHTAHRVRIQLKMSSAQALLYAAGVQPWVGLERLSQCQEKDVHKHAFMCQSAKIINQKGKVIGKEVVCSRLWRVFLVELNRNMSEVRELSVVPSKRSYPGRSLCLSLGPAP